MNGIVDVYWNNKLSASTEMNDFYEYQNIISNFQHILLKRKKKGDTDDKAHYVLLSLEA